MPLQYADGTVAEHMACRTDVAVFDVSHLGTVRLAGPEARPALQRALTNDLAKIRPGKAQYTHLLDEDGSVLDDLIVWWTGEESFDVMPNASNTSRVVGGHRGYRRHRRAGRLAVQGPRSRALMEAVLPEVTTVGHFGVHSLTWRGVPVVVAGTGYTGEEGLECAVPAAAAVALWEAVVAAGAVPAGLGARDTLRLEAGLPLHGHELGPGITPLEAGLAWVVAWDKPGGFRGRDALLAKRGPGHRPRVYGGSSALAVNPCGPVTGSGATASTWASHERQFLARPRVRHRHGFRAPRRARRRGLRRRGPRASPRLPGRAPAVREETGPRSLSHGPLCAAHRRGLLPHAQGPRPVPHRRPVRLCPRRPAFGRGLDLPAGMPEPDVAAEMARLAGANRTGSDLVCFAGGGAYDHDDPRRSPGPWRDVRSSSRHTPPTSPRWPRESSRPSSSTRPWSPGWRGCPVANASLYDGGQGRRRSRQPRRGRHRPRRPFGWRPASTPVARQMLGHADRQGRGTGSWTSPWSTG